MTADETDSLADDSPADDSLADGSPSAIDDSDASNRIEALEATVEALADRVSQLEGNVAWMARQQARETGNGVCPECNAGGALRVERTPTGKKRVRCSRCGEQFD